MTNAQGSSMQPQARAERLSSSFVKWRDSAPEAILRGMELSKDTALPGTELASKTGLLGFLCK